MTSSWKIQRMDTREAINAARPATIVEEKVAAHVHFTILENIESQLAETQCTATLCP
jgi:hypothetical protein